MDPLNVDPLARIKPVSHNHFFNNGIPNYSDPKPEVVRVEKSEAEIKKDKVKEMLDKIRVPVEGFVPTPNKTQKIRIKF